MYVGVRAGRDEMAEGRSRWRIANRDGPAIQADMLPSTRFINESTGE